MKEKQIPFKNYVLLGLIMLITLVVTIYVLAWYKQYENTKINTPVITNTIREVEYNNLDTVLLERDILIMYSCTTNEEICRSFEKKFSGYLKENNLTDDVIYLNLGYNKDENGLLERVYNRYKSNDLVKKANFYPTIMIVNQGKIVDILSSTKKEKITIDKVKEFLESYEL